MTPNEYKEQRASLLNQLVELDAKFKGISSSTNAGGGSKSLTTVIQSVSDVATINKYNPSNRFGILGHSDINWHNKNSTFLLQSQLNTDKVHSSYTDYFQGSALIVGLYLNKSSNAIAKTKMDYVNSDPMYDNYGIRKDYYYRYATGIRCTCFIPAIIINEG